MSRFRPVVAFAGALLLTTLLYWPGLSGSFAFDDFPNIVDNSALHVTSLDSSAWKQAMWSSPASDLQRPLASLSFAANHYLSGLDPWAMKATNLAIHLLNGVLLLALLRRILAVISVGEAGDYAAKRNTWLALAVTTVWLLHPINLTAVLYVVQRMESLAQTFVFAGLLFYIDARIRQADGRPGAGWRLWLGVPACAALGIATKESAAMLPLFAFVMEKTVLSALHRRRTELRVFFATFLFAPVAYGLYRLLPGAVSDAAYAMRPFTAAQRLLTEPRVLFDYATWTLLPLPGFFSFFRDDFPFSTDLWHPWTTLPAIIALLATVVTVIVLRRRRPLVALGLAWFLCAHLLTGTFLALELVFEHRNYFASAGLLLAAFDVLLPGASTSMVRLARTTAVFAVLALSAFTLSVRSRVWGDSLQLALSESTAHPASPRATYELGRTLLIMTGYSPDSPMLPNAIAALKTAAMVPRASTLPEVALIMLASRTGRESDASWWKQIVAKLETRHATREDDAAVESLTQCQREGYCSATDETMVSVYLAALSQPPPNPAMLYSYAIFAHNRLHDEGLALRLSRDAALSSDPRYSARLVDFLIDLGRPDEAAVELDKLTSRVRFGNFDRWIPIARQRIKAAQTHTDRVPEADVEAASAGSAPVRP